VADAGPSTHVHDHDHPHDHHHDHHHDHDNDFPDDVDSPLWDSERIELTSVGIDIGSATTNVMFSTIELRRAGSELSSRYVTVSREVFYASPPRLTPYASGLSIDEVALGAIVDMAFAEAGLSASEVDTGAVLLTGEATRRRNARAIGDLFASRSGSFVCAMAGHDIEAELAAYGSGAVALSRDLGVRLLNIDIGGGTTKFTVVDRGAVVSTAALHVGGRLVAYEDGHIVRVEPLAQQVAARLGFDWQVGAPIGAEELTEVAAWMVGTIVQVAGGRSPDEAGMSMMLSGAPAPADDYDRVLLSGGVAEYLVGDSTDVGDLGRYLAAELARRSGDLPARLEAAQRRISATVVGASQYTVQVSGNTIHLSDKGVLPLSNVRALALPPIPDGDIDSNEIAEAIAASLKRLGLHHDDDVAIAFTWAGAPSHRRLDAFLDGVERGLAERTAHGSVTCLVMDGDVGRSLGWLLAQERGHAAPVVSIDGLSLSDFDFVDIGALMPKSGTVPVSVKSLLFHL
jgi:ethanolamine utilization protein EutA